jgi:hypothetical protein
MFAILIAQVACGYWASNERPQVQYYYGKIPLVQREPKMAVMPIEDEYEILFDDEEEEYMEPEFYMEEEYEPVFIAQNYQDYEEFYEPEYEELDYGFTVEEVDDLEELPPAFYLLVDGRFYIVRENGNLIE